MTKFYYEAHITLDPIFDDELERCRQLCELYHFRVADLLMQKREVDTPTRSKYDTFATARNRSYDELARDLRQCCEALTFNGFIIRRYKIEDTLIDSKFVDELKLLPKRCSHGYIYGCDECDANV